MADWITSHIAIGDCIEPPPDGCEVLDLRPIPDHCKIEAAALRSCVEVITGAIERGNKIFVHCIGGVSRSPSIVAAYLVTVEGVQTVDAAFALIRRYRPIIQPHPDQIASVKEFCG